MAWHFNWQRPHCQCLPTKISVLTPLGWQRDKEHTLSTTFIYALILSVGMLCSNGSFHLNKVFFVLSYQKSNMPQMPRRAYSGTRAELGCHDPELLCQRLKISPQLMVRTRLSAADILHRGVVLSLIGVCVWGIGTGILVHRDTLRMGRGTHIPHRFRFSQVNSDHNLHCIFIRWSFLQR
jgi:Cytochrome oxidase c assembly